MIGRVDMNLSEKLPRIRAGKASGLNSPEPEKKKY
jgi:hypothetical protein